MVVENVLTTLEEFKEVVKVAAARGQTVDYLLHAGMYSKAGTDGWAQHYYDGSAVLQVVIGPRPPGQHLQRFEKPLG